MQVGPGKGKYRIMAEINMIPFIDVALVLLIIFMVMTPFLVRSQIKINIPTSHKVEPQLDRDEALQVLVDREGKVFVDGQPVPSDAIEDTLRRKVRNPTGQPLVIQADKDVPFQRVVTVLDAAKKVGVTRLGISVKLEHDATPHAKR